MSTCLGIYVDKNIIKYAKLTREKNNIRVDAFGVKIYSDLKQTLDQIIAETFSFKIPVSINITEETYNYFYMSNLLNKKDLNKAIETEFDSFCYDNNNNPNAVETRFALVNDANDKEKIKVIHTSIDKIKLNKTIMDYESIKLTTIVPISLAIANIVPLNSKENIIIVNIEDTTTATVVAGEKIYDIKKIDIGVSKILNEINQKENSYAKAYEICKNTTIYTAEGKSLQSESNEYLSSIVPTLYEIASKINDVVEESVLKISKIYITGTASVINNIDLYFEEIVSNVSCEILKPFFIEDSPKINIKDYIEVNSAIALALQGLGYGIQNINFLKEKAQLFSWLSRDGSSEKSGNIFKKLNDINISNNQLSKFVLGIFVLVIIVFAIYTSIDLFIGSEIAKKQEEIETVENNTNKQLSAIKKDSDNINGKVSEYKTLTKNLEDASNTVSQKQSYKNTIPVLLSEIMTIIPKQVQLTSIENTNNKTIVINAQSSKYEQLAYFKAKLKSEQVLQPNSIASSEATKDGDIIKITIEGELP